MTNLQSLLFISFKFFIKQAEGHIVTCETITGEVYRGKLIEAEDNKNSDEPSDQSVAATILHCRQVHKKR